ncbi:bcl-2-binding component 3 isoform X2 [Clinocottus analis]|uniref:bcl-2-binding component 3 isoform X2 n=1 Tax=Clinocottus analis TaxID=304258 RepID=UPI0035C23A16
MARAETIESVGETGGRGGNDPLPSHHTCRMELPRPFYSGPGLHTTTAFTSGTTTVHHHRHHHNHLHPLQALYPLTYPHHEDQDETLNHQRPPVFSPSPPRSPLCNRSEGSGGGAAAPSAFTGEQTDSHRDECRDASSRQGPLPDLLPQNELSSRASPRQRAPAGEAAQEVEVRTVAGQLRAIGDEFNATVLHRAHVAPHWQEWRDACRGLLNFITQTLSTLYRLT